MCSAQSPKRALHAWKERFAAVFSEGVAPQQPAPTFTSCPGASHDAGSGPSGSPPLGYARVGEGCPEGGALALPGVDGPWVGCSGHSWQPWRVDPVSPLLAALGPTGPCKQACVAHVQQHKGSSSTRACLSSPPAAGARPCCHALQSARCWLHCVPPQPCSCTCPTFMLPSLLAALHGMLPCSCRAATHLHTTPV